ncbi:MAG: acyclic terpene utilization AtuA family protein [Chloroflexi bacterium]|nr:acyclic terpene utilization AtuA family protein [Chloroflexota bacterium]
MREMTVYAPMGCLGYGFPEHSLQAAMAQRPALMAVDAGSTDPGPYYLGKGMSYTARDMVKRDLSLLLPAARAAGIPFLIGTAGGAGGKPHLDWCVEIVKEVAAEHGLHFPMARIHAELDKELVKRAVREGRVRDLESGVELTTEEVDQSVRIVAQMGHGPLVEAMNQGAEVVVAGRAYDAALTATLPLVKEYNPGLALHMGKILECGSLVALPRESDGAIGVIRDDHFLISPADPNKYCTVETVAAHTLYEKSDPVHLHMPGGMLDLSDTRFEKVDDRTVKVSGSRFVPSETYAIKLEGARLVGHRSVCIAGTRDPVMIQQIDEVMDRVRAKLRRDLAKVATEQDYRMLFHLYGKNGVMGKLEPQRTVTSHELGIVIEVIAKTQQLANTVGALARSATLHQGYEGRVSTAGNLAFLYSPAEFPAPEVYEFNVYHLMEVADPCEPFRIELERV